MSRSTCWAESLKPIGIPSVASRTSSPKRRKSSMCSHSGKRAEIDVGDQRVARTIGR